MILTGSFDKTARLWSAKTQEPLGASFQCADYVMTVAFSAAGDRVLVGSGDNSARAWRVHANSVSYSPAAMSYAFLDSNLAKQLLESAIGLLQLWNLQPGVLLSAPVLFDPSQNVVATSPDGLILLVRHSAHMAVIWDLRTGTSHGAPIRYETEYSAAAFSADGKTLVTGGQDQQVRLWRVADGELIDLPMRHGGIVKAVAFSKSGKFIVSGSSDQTAMLWDVALGKAIGQPMQHSDEVDKVAFSPDDRLVLTISRDSSARLWDVASCRLVVRPLQNEPALNTRSVKLNDAAFNGDGSAILFRCSDGNIRFYNVPRQLPDDPAVVELWSKTYSGLESSSNGNLRQISQEEWLSAREELHKAMASGRDSRPMGGLREL
jgi:WD40 repeat protein